MALQILPAGTPRRNLAAEFAGNFSSGLMEGGNQGLERRKAKQAEDLRKGEQKEIRQKENAALLNLGYDLRDIEEPETRKQIIANTAADQREARKSEASREKNEREVREKASPYEGALKTVQEMRDIGKKGRLGFGSGIRGLLSKDTRNDRAKYTQLGKSLIQFASNIPIRNKAEFETLAHDLYDPSITDASREGILDAMEAIISNSLRSMSPQMQNEQEPVAPQQKERPPLQSFMR